MFKINDQKNVHNLATNSHVQLGIIPKLSIMLKLKIMLDAQVKHYAWIEHYAQVEHYARLEHMPKSRIKDFCENGICMQS